jgi:hypothetical protein
MKGAVAGWTDLVHTLSHFTFPWPPRWLAALPLLAHENSRMPDCMPFIHMLSWGLAGLAWTLLSWPTTWSCCWAAPVGRLQIAWLRASWNCWMGTMARGRCSSRRQVPLSEMRERVAILAQRRRGTRWRAASPPPPLLRPQWPQPKAAPPLARLLLLPGG